MADVTDITQHNDLIIYRTAS